MIEMKNKNKRNVFSGVGIALLLCALMVLMSWSATVSNGDRAVNSAIVDDEKSTDNLLAEDNLLDEETDESEFDPNMEMLGMRTENSKTYITDSGTATVYTSEPQHMMNDYGQWVEIDYDIIATDAGYSLTSAPTNVDFGLDVEDGFSVELNPGFSLDSGMDIALLDMSPMGISLSSVNGMAGKGSDTYRINEMYSFTTQEVSIGGNEIVYPITDQISVVYTALEGAVKQDIVISEVNQQLKQTLSASGEDGYFGIFETIELPSGYYITSNKIPLSNVDLFETTDSLVIHNEFGDAVGTILKPVALESTDDKEEVVTESGITYFVTVDESGSSIEIITAVEKSWLLSDDTSFPVSIDPTVTYNQDQSAFECIVSSLSCIERTSGVATLKYDWGYEAMEAPTFPFTFTQDTRPVESIDWELYSSRASWSGYGDVVIMEQCGNSGWPSSDNPRDIYNPNACTGNALPPISGGGTEPEHIWTNPSVSTTSDGGNINPSCAGTICTTLDSQGNVIEGIFKEGGYTLYWRDSFGDGPNGGTFDIQTREVDDGTGQPGPWSVYQSVTNGWNGVLYTLTTSVPAGYEMRLDYNCANWCSETSIGVQVAEVGPVLPALTGTPPPTAPACSPNCAPSGLESPTVTLSVSPTDEAEMTWDCGNIGCDYNQVYYRSAGAVGWTDVWDMCGGADPCNQLNTYYSSNDGIFFAFGNWEFLVWDTQADTAAEQFSNGGSGGIDLVPAGTYGTGGGDPITSRWNSLASSESHGTFFQSSSWGSQGTKTGTICVSKADCNSGTPAMISNAINSGSYVEMAVTWGMARNSLSSDNGGGYYTDGLFDISDFKLVVQHESIIVDQTPPVDVGIHYDGVDSYVPGARTLFLSIEDADNPIDTTTNGLPTLIYTVNGGNTQTATSELVSSVCNAKANTCTFAATTGDLQAGDDVSYYWEFQDAAYPTLLKPSQQPNVATSNVATFTIADPNTAPEDGTDMKITTLVTDVDAAYDGGGKSTSKTVTIDRQMTYYQSTNEYHFEFDTSRCGSYSGTDAARACFSTNSNEDYGSWLVSWNNDDSSLCTLAECGGAADNVLDLAKAQGGMLDISRQYGSGDVVLLYDATSQGWAVTVVDATPEIDELLSADAPGAQTVSNDAPGVGFPWTAFISLPNQNWYGSSYLVDSAFVVNSGETMRIRLICGSWCSEMGVTVNGVAMGGAGTYTFGAGTYNIVWTDSFGDGPNGGSMYVEKEAPQDTASLSTYTHSQSGSEWMSYGFAVDFSTAPNFVGQFGEITFGGSETANLMCVTTNGFVYFTDSTFCSADARDADGHDWQGFAMGGTVQGEQDVQTEMVYTIRNVAPEPDTFAPTVDHTSMGDSHSLTRTISAVIEDVGYPADGLNVAPVVDLGPTVHYEIYQTGSTPTGVYNKLVMIPDNPVRSDCELTDCLWQVDLPTLSRGQSVDYKISTRDNSIRGTGPNLENVYETQLVTFDVGEPTNMLIVEWHEYSATSSSTQPCSMQVVMYDVTNEFEFHYDDSCSVNDIVGLTGHRMDTTDFTDIRNVVSTDNGNPHSFNIRVTDGPDGYAYEYFDLGITNPGYLPMASSDQVVNPADFQSFQTDTRCASGTNFNNHEEYCSGNFDMPDEFTFTFYNTVYDGSNSDNRIHVAAEGVMHFIDDGSQDVVAVSGSSWPASGAMDSLGVATTHVPDNMIAPWYSRENMDYCYDDDGCMGVWYRVIPYDGNGINVNSDIVDDTTWYAVDSPIKVNPTDPSGYLTVTADLTIEPGVEVLFAPGTGLSFDGGLQADGSCSEFTALGTSADGITFTVNTEANTYNANGQDTEKYWRGLAFTDECNGGEAERHQFANVEFSNTEFAAITAGSRPHDPSGNGPTCGTSNTDCNVGEFDLTDVTFNNVASAFKHGSGQGTQVTMHNFQVNNGRDACFNFAENTEATLTGTAGAPSTMTNCNTNWNEWGGAVISTPGSTSGSLTMSYVDISESNAAAIRTDLLDIDIANVNVFQSSYMAAWTGPGQNQDETGVSLGLGADATSTVSVTDFYAENYHHAYIYAAGSIYLDNVNLGADQYFDVRPYGKNPSGAALGTSGANSMFTDVTSPAMYVYRSFPMMDQMTINGELKFDEMTGATDTVTIDNSNIAGKLVMQGCGVDISMSTSTIAGLDSFCYNVGANTIDMFDSNVDHSAQSSAIYVSKTKAYLQQVDVTSSSVGGGNHMLYADLGSMVYLIATTYEAAGSGIVQDCASSAGSTGNCDVNALTGGTGVSATDVFYGGFANGLAYRLGTVGGSPGQIPQSNAILTAVALDATGAEVSGATIGSATTDSNGETTMLPVITGNYAGDNFLHQHIRASGAAGFGEAHPTLADGTPATTVTFEAGQAVSPPVPFDTFTIGDSVDIRLTPPPVTFDNPNMNCAWMSISDPNDPDYSAPFQNAYDPIRDAFVFKGFDLALDADMAIDGCTVILEGSELIFLPTNSPSLTISNGGVLIMDVDTDTGDLPKIKGEGGTADAVDVTIGNAGMLEVNAGSISNLAPTATKTGLLVINQGGVLDMSGGSTISAPDVTGLGSNYPIVHVNGGIFNADTVSIFADGSSGAGVYSENGVVEATSLTVSNAETGVVSDYATVILNDYTSTDNTNGVYSVGSMSLPKYYRSLTLENGGPWWLNGYDYILRWLGSFRQAFDWRTHTIDLTPHIGDTDYMQPQLRMTYEGSWDNPLLGGYSPFAQLDNLQVVMEDTSGNQWIVDDSSDVGYYPYSANDPASGTTAATYSGGVGGVPNWDCSYSAISRSPYNSFGTAGPDTTAFATGAGDSMGELYGVTGYGYPEEFGFRYTQGTKGSYPSDQSPMLYWGVDHVTSWLFPQYWFITTTGSQNVANYGPGLDVCDVFAWVDGSTLLGTNVDLEFPIIDLTDPSLAKVYLQFDMYHEYDGNAYGNLRNNNPDNVQVMTRGSDDPADMGTYSELLPGQGLVISDSTITGAETGIELAGDTVGSITNVDVIDPSSVGLVADGYNVITVDGLSVTDSVGTGLTVGILMMPTATGVQEFSNSNFDGVNTAIALNNDVQTTISSTTINDATTGIMTGTQSGASYTVDDVTMTNVYQGVFYRGTGEMTFTDTSISSTDYDVNMLGSGAVTFVDGTVDQTKVDITSTGTFFRDRSYVATLTANGAPVVGANVILSSRDAVKSSFGLTDANGQTDGLTFAIYSMDANQVTDFTPFLNTYELNSIATIAYDWTDSSTNTGDFRYIFTSAALQNVATDVAGGVNAESFAFVNNVDVRVCSNSGAHTVVAPCAGTLADTGSRTFTDSVGMVEYGSEEALFDASGTMDLSNKAIMIDSGVLELRDGMTYNFDDSIVMQTGYETIYNLGQWYSEEPYGTVIEMDGGSVNVLSPESSSGQPIGLSIGGKLWTTDSPVGFDINDVQFNGIASISAYNGNYELGTGDWTGYSDYEVPVFSLTNSYLNHYRGYRSEFQNVLYDVDMCVRIGGGTNGVISGNSFSDCTVGVYFDQSDWNEANPSQGSRDTSIAHTAIGADAYTVTNNVFNGGSGFNVWFGADSSADSAVISDNTMNCDSCIAHVSIYDGDVLFPKILNNVMTNGDTGVYSNAAEHVKISGNEFNNIETVAVWVEEGDADITDNEIYNSGGAIIADSMTKPISDAPFRLVAGVNTQQPESASFTDFTGGYSSDDITFTLSAGEEMVMEYLCVSWCSETTVRILQPNNAVYLWTTMQNGNSDYESIDEGLYFTDPGTYTFNVEDSFGDGPNGGSFWVYAGDVGTWTAAGGGTTSGSWGSWSSHSDYYAFFSSNCQDSSTLGEPCVSNRDSAQVVWTNPDTFSYDYEFTMRDSFGDGPNGNWIAFETAPLGTWSNNLATRSPGSGTFAGAIYTSGYSYTPPLPFPSSGNTVSWNSGTASDVLSISLDPGMEMRFYIRCIAWCSESSVQWEETINDPTWIGPDIDNNLIENIPSSSNFDPLAFGIELSNCDMTAYSVYTTGNIIKVGNDAIITSGCIWEDKDSQLIGSDVPNSIGFDDDNGFVTEVSLDGTQISGFETGLIKTGGSLLINGGSFTASGTGHGIITDGIDVSVIGATVDGDVAGTGMLIQNSQLAYLYPMDATGNVGVEVVDSELQWDAGNVDADTILKATGSTGYVTDLTDTGTGTQIEANGETILTTVGYSLDASRMTVDSTSIVHEANYLTIDADHLGDEPNNVVGLKVISDQNYAAYQSTTFNTAIGVDGILSDWYSGNELNPSGYATPGNIGGPMWVTSSSSNLVMAFENVDTSTDDVYVYFNTNDIGGLTTGLNNVHTLPFGAEFALKITDDATSSSATTQLFARDVSDAWIPAPSGAINSDEADVLEVSVPLSSLLNGDTLIDMVAVVTNAGTDDITQTSPLQSGGQMMLPSTGPVSLDDSYRMMVGSDDLATGNLYYEVLLHRSFMFSSVPTAAHNYDIMVKTLAEPSNCQFDWAETQAPVQMNAAQSLTFDILRACPVITPALQDIEVLEDSTGYTFDLSTFVDDEQDDETVMQWSVVAGAQNTHQQEVLSDWTDLTDAVGSQTIIPVTDKFGDFELTFEVVDSHGQTVSKTVSYIVTNVNDKPIICDLTVDADCSTQEVHLSASTDIDGNDYYNVRTEGFGSYSRSLGDVHNSIGTAANSVVGYVVDLDNENVPTAQKYEWSASALCDQFTSVTVETRQIVDDNGDTTTIQELVVVENTAWEYGGVCDITLDLTDDGLEFCFDSATGTVDSTIAEADCTGVWMGETSADTVVVPFSVAPVNDNPVIAIGGNVPSADGANQFIGDTAGDYRVTLVEDTTDADQLTFDLSAIKSDIDHVDADLTWQLRDTGTQCTSSNYFTTSITGDTLVFDLIEDATTNAEPWEVDMLYNNGIHQQATDNGYCEMYLTLSDSVNAPSYMPNYNDVPSAVYEQKTDEIVLSVKIDNVAENVPDYFFDATEGFDFNGVNNIMPGTFVPVDFTINAGGDEGPYNYNHVLVVDIFTNDGYRDTMRITPPAYGESHDVDDWEVYISETTTEIWVEMDVVTLLPSDGSEQVDSPESHHLVQSNQLFAKWSAPGAIGTDADAATADSNRRPAFEDKNWCNNMMSTNGGVEVGWSAANQCQHSEQGYNGAFAQPWENAGNAIPTRVTTIGALSVASFAPSIIAVALTGLFVSALVLAGRRDDDEEEFVEETISDDESAVSPVIATILMVAITVVLSGVVYVWAAQLADTDTKGVPRVTFDATNVDTGDTATDHWKITIGQAQTVLATQAVEVQVTYANSVGEIVSETTNLASTNQVYGFSPFNSNQLVTFGDVVTLNDGETISSFSTGDDIYVKTHDADGTPLVDATIRIVYNPPGEAQGAVLKTYTGLSWNQPV